MSALFTGVDLILMPTAAAQPWPAEKTHPDVIDGVPVGPRGHAVYTGWVNASGHPAIALPAGSDAKGMPIGAQLIGDLGSEELLLTVAETLEDGAQEWRWPPLASR